MSFPNPLGDVGAYVQCNGSSYKVMGVDQVQPVGACALGSVQMRLKRNSEFDYSLFTDLGQGCWHETQLLSTGESPFWMYTQHVHQAVDPVSGPVTASQLIVYQPQVEQSYVDQAIAPLPVNSENDFGGITHAGNQLVSAKFICDNTEADIAIGECVDCMDLKLFQTFVTDPDNSLALANETMCHRFVDGCVVVTHQQEWLRDASIGWYYPGTLPVLQEASGVPVFTDYFVLGQAPQKPGNFPAPNGKWGGHPQYQGRARGVVLGKCLDYSIQVLPFSVNNYMDAAPGFRTCWIFNRVKGVDRVGAKLYFQRCHPNTPCPVSAGDVWNSHMTYCLKIC